MKRDEVAKEFFRGMNLGFMGGAGYYRRPDIQAHVDRMAEAGVRWVCVMANIVQDAFYSTKVYHDYKLTPADGELEGIIDRIHKRGMKVMLKLINTCLDSYWMGNIDFHESGEQIQGVKRDYWSDWFASFGDALVHYGQLMERSGGELFCLSGELSGTEKQTDHWKRVLSRVREVYSGAVTYEAYIGNFNQPKTMAWAEDLDLLAVSAYPRGPDKECASANEMAEHFLSVVVPDFRKQAATLNRPVFFAEIGCRSVQGGAKRPWDFHSNRLFDGAEQSNYLEAIFRSFGKEPWWKGMFWWKWDETQNRPQYHMDPSGDTGFTLEGKPALATLTHLYANAR